MPSGSGNPDILLASKVSLGTSNSSSCGFVERECDNATRALQRDESQSAVLAGVHSLLVPSVSHLYAAGRLTSKRGRSHTFDSRADGFGRGEACGSALLGAEECVGCVQLTGAAVRQDGKSASLTAPNGQAQQAVLRAARADAFEMLVSYLEAHGTGTALGDPTEVRAVVGTLLAGRVSSFALMATKANIGHAEAASGCVGVLKVLCLLADGGTAGNAQLRLLNPLVHEQFISSHASLPMHSTAASGVCQRERQAV